MSVAIWSGGLVASDQNDPRLAFLLFALASVIGLVTFVLSARFVVVSAKKRAGAPFLVSVVAIFGGLGGLFMTAIAFFAALITSSESSQSIP